MAFNDHHFHIQKHYFGDQKRIVLNKEECLRLPLHQCGLAIMRPARGDGGWVLGNLGFVLGEKRVDRWKIDLNEDASTDKSAYP